MTVISVKFKAQQLINAAAWFRKNYFYSNSKVTYDLNFSKPKRRIHSNDHDFFIRTIPMNAEIIMLSVL